MEGNQLLRQKQEEIKQRLQALADKEKILGSGSEKMDEKTLLELKCAEDEEVVSHYSTSSPGRVTYTIQKKYVPST